MTESGASSASENTATEQANIAIVGEFWEALKQRDFDAVGAFMSEQGHYVDVPLIGGEEGAIGPAETAARLRLGLGPLEKYILHDGPIIASGNTVITEHREEWFWNTGEYSNVRFCSVMELSDGKVDRWWDYVDIGQLMGTAPEWWVEHVMLGYK